MIVILFKAAFFCILLYGILIITALLVDIFTCCKYDLITKHLKYISFPAFLGAPLLILVMIIEFYTLTINILWIN